MYDHFTLTIHKHQAHTHARTVQTVYKVKQRKKTEDQGTKHFNYRNNEQNSSKRTNEQTNACDRVNEWDGVDSTKTKIEQKEYEMWDDDDGNV